MQHWLDHRLLPAGPDQAYDLHLPGPSALHLDEETGSLYVGDLSAVRVVAVGTASVRFAIGNGGAGGVPAGLGAPGGADDEECLRL